MSWMTKLLGDKGERLAVRHLRRQGYRILARQHSIGAGEIDLIALDGDCVVFVEVKTRAGVAAGHPTEAVTPAKQKKLTDLALVYLKRHGLLEHRARFDVVAVVLPGGRAAAEITHYRNAFEPAGQGQMFA